MITDLAAQSQLDFGVLIAQLRTRAKMSARAVSKAANLSPSYLSKVERGEMVPTVATFSALMTILHATDAEITFLVRLFGTV